MDCNEDRPTIELVRALTLLEKVTHQMASAIEITPSYETLVAAETRFSYHNFLSAFPAKTTTSSGQMRHFKTAGGKSAISKIDGTNKVSIYLEGSEDFKKAEAELNLEGALGALMEYPFLAAQLYDAVHEELPQNLTSLRRTEEFLKFIFSTEAVTKVANYLVKYGFVISRVDKKSIIHLLFEAETQAREEAVADYRRAVYIAEEPEWNEEEREKALKAFELLLQLCPYLGMLRQYEMSLRHLIGLHYLPEDILDVERVRITTMADKPNLPRCDGAV